MGQTTSQLSQILPQGPTVPVVRYTIEVDVRYRGRVKAYKYVSKSHGIEIFPFDSTNPVTPYDETNWKGMSNPSQTVYMKESLLLQCQEFLKAKEMLTNELQKNLSVS